MNTTDNYKLPLYEGDDNPNLISGYNEAIKTLDATVKENEDTLNTLKGDTDKSVEEINNTLNTHINVEQNEIGETVANGIATQNNYGHVLVIDQWNVAQHYMPEYGYVPSMMTFTRTADIAKEAYHGVSRVAQAQVLANGTLNVTG